MDFNLKQWRDESELEEDQGAAKLPRLLLNSYPQHQQPPPASSSLLLSVPDSNANVSALSPDHSSTTAYATKFPSTGSYFSSSQWQELELQALIFRHMIAGAAVPPELLHLVRKSLINSPTPYYPSDPLHQYFPHHCQPALLQPGHWGRAAMDPEPGRCRRTDGKKWRCSRDVVVGQKYCERHMHRGRNRSRKPVEIPTSNVTPYGGEALETGHSISRQGVDAAVDGSHHFTLSTDLLHLNRRPSESIVETIGPFESQNDEPNSRILRHFFDDWPKPVHETECADTAAASATALSISMPGNPSSDFSLKLGTGSREEPGATDTLIGEKEKPQLNWGMAWETNPVAPMGGPLAEVLRSSASNSSPTSVLHPSPRGGPASGVGCVSS